MGSVCRGERREGASGVSLLLRTGQPWSGSITITWEFITGAEYQLHLASVIQHLHLTRDPRSLCTAHIRETVASATSQVCGSALGDLSQDKVPFKGRSGFPRGPPVVGTILISNLSQTGICKIFIFAKANRTKLKDTKCKL